MQSQATTKFTSLEFPLMSEWVAEVCQYLLHATLYTRVSCSHSDLNLKVPFGNYIYKSIWYTVHYIGIYRNIFWKRKILFSHQNHQKCLERKLLYACHYKLRFVCVIHFLTLFFSFQGACFWKFCPDVCMASIQEQVMMTFLKDFILKMLKTINKTHFQGLD